MRYESRVRIDRILKIILVKTMIPSESPDDQVPQRPGVQRPFSSVGDDAGEYDLRRVKKLSVTLKTDHVQTDKKTNGSGCDFFPGWH